MRFDARRQSVVLVSVLALLLAGCRASGTVDVRSAEEVAVDLVFVDVSYEQAPCNPHAWGPNFPLETLPGVTPDGRLTCRVRGVTHPARLSRHLTLTAAGEYLSFGYNPLAIGPDGRLPIGDARLTIDDLDLTVAFPGRVLGANGAVDGSSVRFVDAGQLARPHGLQATALDHPGPAWSVLGPLFGLVAGLAIGVLWSLRRRGQARSADTDGGASAGVRAGGSAGSPAGGSVGSPAGGSAGSPVGGSVGDPRAGRPIPPQPDPRGTNGRTRDPRGTSVRTPGRVVRTTPAGRPRRTARPAGDGPASRSSAPGG